MISMYVFEVTWILSSAVQNLLSYMKIIQNKCVPLNYHSWHLEYPMVLTSIRCQDGCHGLHYRKAQGKWIKILIIRSYCTEMIVVKIQYILGKAINAIKIWQAGPWIQNMPTPGFTLDRPFCSSNLDTQCVLNSKILSERPFLSRGRGA